MSVFFIIWFIHFAAWRSLDFIIALFRRERPITNFTMSMLLGLISGIAHYFIIKYHTFLLP